MARRTRRIFTPAFKAEVLRALLTGNRSHAELCLYERGRAADAERKRPTSYAFLTLARFNREWLTDGRDSQNRKQ